MFDVVRLGPGDRGPAAGPGAALRLLELQLVAEGHVGEAPGAAQFDRFASAVVEDRGDDPGLAGEEAGLGDGDRLAVELREPPGLVAAKGLDIAGEVQGRGVAVPLGSVGSSAVGGDHLVQGLCVAAGDSGEQAVGVLVLLARRGDCGPQGVAEELAGVVGEQAFDVPHAIGALVDFQPGQGLLAQLGEERLLVEELGADAVQVLGEFGAGGVDAVLPDQLFGSPARGAIRGLDRGGVGDPGVHGQAFTLDTAHGVGDGVDAGGPREGGLGEVLELRGEAGNGGDLPGAGLVETEGLFDPVANAGEAVALFVKALGSVSDDCLQEICLDCAELSGEGVDLGAQGGRSRVVVCAIHPAHPLGSYPIVCVAVIGQ
jgi:hypothetical protein